MTFSIVICTYNRGDILHHCLESIYAFGDITESYEVVIIDNASSDSTSEVVNSYKSKISNLKYIYEPIIGLSHARNRGAIESSSDWLFYLDDDAKLKSDTLQQFYNVISNYDFKLFTGVYEPWYIDFPPKWLKGNLVSYILKGEKGIRTINEDYVSGGIMGVNKLMLIDLGMFDTELGMKGSRIGYGEESDLQFKAMQNGYSVGINTDMIMDHLVGKHKYDYKWFLSSSLKKGEDAFSINPTDLTFTWKKIILSIIERTVKNAVRTSSKLLFKKDYYFINWYIDNFSSLAGYYGIVKSKLKFASHQK